VEAAHGCYCGGWSRSCNRMLIALLAWIDAQSGSILKTPLPQVSGLTAKLASTNCSVGADLLAKAVVQAEKC